MRITRAVEFSSSLRYRRPELSDAENRRLFGRAAQPHGHNYRLEVTLAGEPDPVSGMVLDLKDLKDLLEREIVARFDHKDLVADTPYFEKDAPTPENLAALVFRLLEAALPPGMLAAVRLHQDADCFVDVTAPERTA